MDIKSRNLIGTLPSRRLSPSSPSLSSIHTLFQDIPSTTKTRSISTFQSTMELTTSAKSPLYEMLRRPPQTTGSSQDPSDPSSFPSSTPFCFPNRTTVSSHSTLVEARPSVLCISPLVCSSQPLLSFTIPSCETSGRIASNPFYRKQGSDESKQASAK